MRREPYTATKLYYDAPQRVEVGDYIQSSRSAYMVTEVRRSPTIRFRKYLRVMRWPVDRIPDGARVHELFWYPRKRRQR